MVVKRLASKHTSVGHAINAFKLVMVNFDQRLFFDTYTNLLQEKTFEEIFEEIFIPLLNEIGLLWQTDSVTPANEHFITGLIKQKIIVNIESLRHIKSFKKDKVFVLYLPENEIHELGLLYINYKVVTKGYKSIYLGQTVPIENLRDVTPYFNNIIFVSYFTIAPSPAKIKKYLRDFDKMVEDAGISPQLWLLGRQTQFIKDEELPVYVRMFYSITDLTKEL